LLEFIAENTKFLATVGQFPITSGLFGWLYSAYFSGLSLDVEIREPGVLGA
jgi:hypothetical protein